MPRLSAAAHCCFWEAVLKSQSKIVSNKQSHPLTDLQFFIWVDLFWRSKKGKWIERIAVKSADTTSRLLTTTHVQVLFVVVAGNLIYFLQGCQHRAKLTKKDIRLFEEITKDTDIFTCKPKLMFHQPLNADVSLLQNILRNMRHCEKVIHSKNHSKGSDSWIGRSMIWFTALSIVPFTL